MLRSLQLVLLIGSLLGATSALADDLKSFELIVKDHAFQPKQLVIPAGEKVKIVVKNQDATPMEFESYDLGREKIILGNTSANVFIGPLEPGTYNFFEEFHPGTTGSILVK